MKVYKNLIGTIIYRSVQICTIWKCANLYNMEVYKFVQYGSVQICINNQLCYFSHIFTPSRSIPLLENPGKSGILRTEGKLLFYIFGFMLLQTGIFFANALLSSDETVC